MASNLRRSPSGGAHGNSAQEYRRGMQEELDGFQKLYMSQHCDQGGLEYAVMNQMNDIMWETGAIIKAIPSYKSGKNPNYYEEYFSCLAQSDCTNTTECRDLVSKEYQGRRWSYFQHLSAYQNGITRKDNQRLDKVELWRRFHLREPPPPVLCTWYFDPQRKVGDIQTVLPTTWRYIDGASDFLCPSFSNCANQQQTFEFGSVHVAVGFVDLGLLIDSTFRSDMSTAPMLFRGFDANSFVVARTMVFWEMMQSPKVEPRWVVQVWYSTVWSKRATNEFLAAARRVVANECADEERHPATVRVLLHHWSNSKGVGLKKIVRRRGPLRNESSDALYFAAKDDRVEMLRYHLTGSFGLQGDAPCSGSILMFDNPLKIVKSERHSVFETLSLKDVVCSEEWNGSFFQTAEKVKEARVRTLMEHAQAGRVKVKLSVSLLDPDLTSPAIAEIRELNPKSISWSNILDYMTPSEFHKVAKACSETAIHSGYSMNWTRDVFGAHLIDYPTTSMEIIRDAERKSELEVKKLCKGRGRIFSVPFQHNPLNTTISLLASRCHSYWAAHFFRSSGFELLEVRTLESTGNPLSRINSTVVCRWAYNIAA
ncbi:expressed unknown protein [Seminavis robusta]|uniref:Uncharacterized protein n=1 Tax=Seminavis robusta TaxID=568900 RepID=A0A9N8D6S6_9STRA|nr:expressed unknown protein [Seminavis robusta]|eukprot:Sro19_g013710.1 n/a (596) ;mRNA; r:163450-165237